MRLLFPDAVMRLPVRLSSGLARMAVSWSDGSEPVDWPELGVQAIAERESIGVAFSGGGSRAYVAALGQLAALHELDLLKRVRYIAGVSGGAWATAVYCYGADSELEEGQSLLGEVRLPSSLSWAGLVEVSKRSACGAVACRSLPALCLRGVACGLPPGRAWAEALHMTFLEPLGMPAGASFTYSPETLSKLQRAHPTLNGRAFATCGCTPYPILGMCRVGPSALAPYAPGNRAFTMIEATPLYVGRPQGDAWLGGWVEPFTFGSDPAADPAQRPLFSLVDALAASSFFAGAPLAAISQPAPRSVAAAALGRGWRERLGLSVPSVTAETAGRATGEVLLADGGSICNPPLIPLLQRGVETVLAFFNVGERLPPATEWDPFTQPLHEAFSDDLPAFFGVASTQTPSMSKMTDQNTVFERSAFAPLVRQLQQSQAAGRGAVASVRLRTVANEWWGISAGQQVTVIWFYICEAQQWEHSLPLAVRSVLREGRERTAAKKPLLASRTQPREVILSAARNAVPRAAGRLDGFPQYPLTRLHLTHVQAGALHQLSAWVVSKNAAILKECMASSPAEPEGDSD